MRLPWNRRRRPPADGPIDVLVCLHATGRSRALVPGAGEGTWLAWHALRAVVGAAEREAAA